MAEELPTLSADLDRARFTELEDAVDELEGVVGDLGDDVADLEASLERIRAALQASLEAQRTLVNIVESQAADLKRLAQIVGLLLDRGA